MFRHLLPLEPTLSGTPVCQIGAPFDFLAPCEECRLRGGARQGRAAEEGSTEMV